MSAILRGPWTAPKPPPCTSSAPGHKGQPSAFPHKCQGWITPLMQHSLCRGLQLPDTWAGVVAKGWRGHPWLSSAQGPAPAPQPRQGTRPVHISQQSKNLTLCRSHLGCKALPPSSSPQHNQERCSQGWLWLLPQPRDALLGPPAKQRCCWDTPSSLPSPPRPAGLSQLLTEGDGGGHRASVAGTCSSPRASAVFLQHRNHQEQARQQERRLSQRSGGEERISPPSRGFHPPSWLSSTCCSSRTCHKVCRRGKAEAELLSTCPQMY